MFLYLIKFLDNILTYILRACIIAVRPLLGPSGICSFTIGCTDYALMQLTEYPFHKALFHIIHRLLLCNPISGIFRKLYTPASYNELKDCSK